MQGLKLTYRMIDFVEHLRGHINFVDNLRGHIKMQTLIVN